MAIRTSVYTMPDNIKLSQTDNSFFFFFFYKVSLYFKQVSMILQASQRHLHHWNQVRWNMNPTTQLNITNQNDTFNINLNRMIYSE